MTKTEQEHPVSTPDCIHCQGTGECAGCAGVGKWHTVECSECKGTGDCFCVRRDEPFSPARENGAAPHRRVTVIKPGITRPGDQHVEVDE